MAPVCPGWCSDVGLIIYNHVDGIYHANKISSTLASLIITTALLTRSFRQKLPRGTESATPGSEPATITAAAGSSRCTGPMTGERRFGRNMQDTIRQHQLSVHRLFRSSVVIIFIIPQIRIGIRRLTTGYRHIFSWSAFGGFTLPQRLTQFVH